MRDREIVQTLSEVETEAVREAAGRMRAFSEAYRTIEGAGKVRHKTGGPGEHNPHRGARAPRPDQPLEDLQEAGKIDRRREAQLTALALRVSRGETKV